MNIRISKSYKLPTKGARGRERLYPYNEMEIGDSFSIPENMRSNAINSARYFARTNTEGFKVATRLVEDKVRVWRVA